MITVVSNTTNIVLVGFMGAGKSTIGSLARGYPWISGIPTQDRRSCRNLYSGYFRTHGEKYFRRLEYRVLCDLINLQGVVISTGGGAVTNGTLLDNLLSRVW